MAKLLPRVDIDTMEKIQCQYFLELNHGDVHAVDKWARMLTKNILEFSRIMWNERCTIVAAERDASYDGRKRRQMWILCSYLNRNPDLLPPHKLHIIQKEQSYFQRQPLDNILMWKRHLDIILDPHHNPQKTKITQHFRPPTPKKPLPSAPTCTQKRKADTSPKPKKKKEKKKQKVQSTLSTPSPPSPEQPLHLPPPIENELAIVNIRRSERIKNKSLPPPKPPTKSAKAKRVEKPHFTPKIKPSPKLRGYQEKLNAFIKDNRPHQKTPNQLVPPPPTRPSHPNHIPPPDTRSSTQPATTRIPPKPSSHFKSYQEKLNLFSFHQSNTQPTARDLSSSGFKRCREMTPPNVMEYENLPKKSRSNSPTSNSTEKITLATIVLNTIRSVSSF